MKVRRFEPADTERIERFGARLRAADVDWAVYPEGSDAGDSFAALTRRLFVAEESDEVRGAIWLHEHDFLSYGVPLRAGWAKYPVSEGLLDTRFGGVAAALLIKLIREQPRLMALGMGGHGGTFARLLASMRWTGVSVPFFVRLPHPASVLRELPSVRGTALRRVLLDFAAYSGLGWLGARLFESFQRARGPSPSATLRIEVVDRFEAWADRIWERARAHYALVARRDSAMLNVVYPADMPIERLRVWRGPEEIGWAVVRRRAVRHDGSGAFGRLRVGLIADGLALPEDALDVTAAADRFLSNGATDIIVSNQSHRAWGDALLACGYLRAPSQFGLYWSRAIADIAGPAIASGTAHFNRGDCDGPMFA